MASKKPVFSDGAGPDQPRTHVLIVAVGHYPAFEGGGPGADPGAPLAQLTSPPVSARALADWFITRYAYPAAPLGSLTLLISEKRRAFYQVPGGEAIDVGEPDYPSFADAVREWCDRGTHPASRLIFIFCGHGFGYGPETSLLLSDFDFRRPDCWDSALDLGTLIAGMEEVGAAEQIFFVDACRAHHPAQLAPGAAIGRSPVQVRRQNPRDGMPRRNAPVFFATGGAQPARGKVGGVSVFTEAFLKAVEGMAARDDEGDWRVSNFSLLEAMDHVSRRLTQEHFAEPQQPQGSEARRFEIHHLRGDPISAVYLKRQYSDPCGPAELRYCVGGNLQTRPCSAQETEVELALPFGNYEFELVGPDGTIVAHGAQRSAPIYKTAVLTP